MREPIKDRVRLEHIIKAIDIVLKNIESVSFERFESDAILFGGIVYQTLIIGEATYKLSHQFTETHTEVVWRDIADMRHHLVHGYYQVDARILWDIIQNDLRPLKSQVENILKDTDWEEWEQKNFK